jgi:Icc-related predicted phosphoesterase
VIISAISDLHGHLPSIREVDLLVIAGDITPRNIHTNISASLHWFNNTFIDYLNTIKVNAIAIIAGNHDFLLLKYKDLFSTADINKEVFYFPEGNPPVISYKGKKIWGTPWSRIWSPHGNDAFAHREDQLERLYKIIPHNLDILISHDMPFDDDFESDDTIYARSWSHSIGSVELSSAIEQRNIKYCICGHIHSEHDTFMIGKTRVYNVGLVEDDSYQMIYKPTYINI